MLSGALRAGKICRLCKRVRRRKKKQTPKNGCLADCSITMGALPGAFMCESRAIFFSQKNCRWIQLLKSGLQVVCVCFTTGESAKIPSTCVFLKPWWVQEVAAGLEKYLGFKGRRKEATQAWLYTWNEALGWIPISQFTLGNFLI